MDMWYVLEAPRGSAASTQTAAEKRLRKQQQAGQAKGGVGVGAGVGDEDEVSESTKRTICMLLEAVLLENMLLVVLYTYARAYLLPA